MKIGIILTTVLMPLIAGCNSPLASLEKVCRQSAHIEIHAPAAWAAYLTAVTAVDLETQRAIAHDRLTGPSRFPPDLQAFIRPFPYVTGYDLVDRSKVPPDSAGAPYPKLSQVMLAGKAIATIRDFEIESDHFGYTDFPTCSRDYPEVFGLRRIVVDHY